MLHVHYDKQIITGMTNSSNSGKVEMYSHSRSDLFFLQSSNLTMAMAFLPSVFIHTQIPVEASNVVNVPNCNIIN